MALRSDDYHFLVYDDSFCNGSDGPGGPGNLLGELPMGNNPSWSQSINSPGSLTGSVFYPNQNQAGRTAVNSMIWDCLNIDGTQSNGGMRYLIVDLNGSIVWGGWLTGVTKNQGINQPTVDITAKEILGYSAQRVIRRNYLVPCIDAFQLILQLLADMQSVLGGCVGLQYNGSLINTTNFPSSALGLANGTTETDNMTTDPTGWPTGSGALHCGLGITQQYFAYEFTTVDQIFQDTTGSDGIIETTVQWAYVDGVPTPTLQMGAPAAPTPIYMGSLWNTGTGTPPDGTYNGLDADLTRCPAPGYIWPMDITQGGNRAVELGFGEGANQLWAYAEVPVNTDNYTGPLLEQVVEHTELLTAPMLQEVAKADLSINLGGVYAPTVPFRVAPQNEPYPSLVDIYEQGLGSEIRCYIGDDENFPATRGGLNRVMRIVDISVAAPDKGNSVVTLTLNRPYVLFGQPGELTDSGTEDGFSVVGM